MSAQGPDGLPEQAQGQAEAQAETLAEQARRVATQAVQWEAVDIQPQTIPL